MNRQRKRENRLKVAEQKVVDWYNRNSKSNAIRRYFDKFDNPNSTRYDRERDSFTTKYAKPAYDALVVRMVEHKNEVKELRKRNGT